MVTARIALLRRKLENQERMWEADACELEKQLGIVQRQRKLLAERDTHVDRLQHRCSELLSRARGLRYQVREFHLKFNRPVAFTPGYPTENRIRHRMRLVAEEFFELLEAQFLAWGTEPWLLRKARDITFTYIDNATIDPSRFVDVADALGDLDYVVEGTRAEYGFDGWPIACAIHAANMRKVDPGGGEDEKIAKPPGWRGPELEILKALVRQGL